MANSKSAISKPYVILISLDGFRWDYVERLKPPHMSQFVKEGVKAESLIPVFPTKTFPNHYTIATGMYPDKHGIIGNSFYDYDLQKKYSISDRETVEDGRFYKGKPLWVNAAQSGMVTASYYFVGSEAKIDGLRPSHYFIFDSDTEKHTQVTQVLDWLSMPEDVRPHFITMYFKDVDKTTHDWSPNNEQKLAATLFDVDRALGALFQGVEQSGLDVNIIIVSDHGMTEVKVDKYIPLDTIYNDELYFAVNNGSLVNIHPKNDSAKTFKYLKNLQNSHPFKVYKTEEFPGFEQVPNNKNWGEFQLVADDGYYFSSSKSINSKKASGNTNYGVHGYDFKNKDMHGIFYANGPAFKKGYSRASVKNIHIYPLICEILDLKIPKSIDGKLMSIKDVLVSKK